MSGVNGQHDTPMSEQAFQDIANAVHRLRTVFKRHGLTPPKSLEVGTHDDGMRLQTYLPRELVVYMPRMTDKPDPEWVCTIGGVEFRWPGRWREYVIDPDMDTGQRKGRILE